MKELCRRRGLTRIEIGVIASICLLLLVCAVPALNSVRRCAFRADCRRNLGTIGRAMLAYAGDYEGKFPRAGGRDSIWGPLTNWMGYDNYRAFGLRAYGSGGQTTVSSSLYLLAKHGYIRPEAFVCKGDAGTRPFRLAEIPYLPRQFELSDGWDFGPASYSHCSYSYHIPFALYALTTSREPGLAVAADRNPWIGSPAADAKDIRQFKPDITPYKGSREQARTGNSISHEQDGQNVLFLDGHVSFQKRAYCGIDRDNIYLIAAYPDRATPHGTPPVPNLYMVANMKDSVLIHDPRSFDPVIQRGVTTHQAQDVDSNDLLQTAVVATLDCPLPEEKNAIWCSTFQMARDKLRNDIIGEPIQVVGAEELARRLNHTEFPMRDIEPESCYAIAGFVKDGIIQQIQKDMAKRFPSESRPTFDNRYRTLADVIVAYAYLNVDVGFKYPFYTRKYPFVFKNSNRIQTEVTSFCTHAPAPDPNSEQVREQVEILHYKHSPMRDTTEFVVDVSKHTTPYQVVLACMPKCETLGEAIRAIQEKATEFKSHPDYQTLRKLRPIDELVVPDVLFRLAHHYENLLNKHLGNQRWRGFFFFEAMQEIDFTLSRTGVVLVSYSQLASARRGSLQVEQPRHLYFDRPFLIYVKKRDADAAPFFIMWVDNAELMKKYE